MKLTYLCLFQQVRDNSERLDTLTSSAGSVSTSVTVLY